VIDGVLLKRSPNPHPEELVSVAHRRPGINVKELPPLILLLHLPEQTRAFQDIGLWTNYNRQRHRAAEPEQVPASALPDGILGILRRAACSRRSLTRKDDTPGSPDTVMLSYGYCSANSEVTQIAGRGITRGR